MTAAVVIACGLFALLCGLVLLWRRCELQRDALERLHHRLDRMQQDQAAMVRIVLRLKTRQDDRGSTILHGWLE